MLLLPICVVLCLAVGMLISGYLVHVYIHIHACMTVLCLTVGMLIGGYLWGSLADVFGRKRTLLSAMLLNGVCGLVAAFSPNFYFFLFFRFASGLG